MSPCIFIKKILKIKLILFVLKIIIILEKKNLNLIVEVKNVNYTKIETVFELA